MPKQRREVQEVIAAQLQDQEQGRRSGNISVYSCPDCGGALWQLGNEQQLEFCCHLGHAYSAQTLVVHKSRLLEQAIMEAVRGLREKGLLLRQLSVKLNPGSTTTAQLIEQADQHEEHARLLQTHLLEGATGMPSSDMTSDLMAAVIRETNRPFDD